MAAKFLDRIDNENIHRQALNLVRFMAMNDKYIIYKGMIMSINYLDCYEKDQTKLMKFVERTPKVFNTYNDALIYQMINKKKKEQRGKLRWIYFRLSG